MRIKCLLKPRKLPLCGADLATLPTLPRGTDSSYSWGSVPFSSFVRTKFEKCAQYVWKPLFISKLISCTSSWEGKRNPLGGGEAWGGFPEEPSLQASFHYKWLHQRPIERRSQVFTFLHRLFPFVLWRRENANALLILEPSTNSFCRFLHGRADF